MIGISRGRIARDRCAPLAARAPAAAMAAAQSLAPDITVTRVINAPVADVWKAWTTAEGIESFFAPKAAKVEPWPGGAFELWFGVNLPEGSARQRRLQGAQREADGAARVRMERATDDSHDPRRCARSSISTSSRCPTTAPR